ncbi:MAG TPA: condensation domain-containing protein, partial [Thermoanaerobaculia bacterium]|nr:condensation domain-containing protein [Thermoanaerobaculia bacterium]
AEPETGLECPPGRVGEIWIAGPSVARGYWRNAEATARDFGAVLTGLPGEVDGPFLRTGDLGFVADGELYVTGRLKDLVIIRGRNHYPQDLELTAESSHPDLRAGSGAAFAVEVEGEERLILVQEVERRLRGDVSEVAEAIRQAVAAEHEVQVWEVVLVRPGGVPKTSSGKVRRSACRAAYLEGELPVVGRSALSSRQLPAERVVVPPPLGGWTVGSGGGQEGGFLPWLRERAARLLGMAPASLELDRPLTALGLDSLSAVELKGQAEVALGVELPLADLLQGASLGELAERLEGGASLGEVPPLRALPREGDQPVSFGQRSLWFLERLAPEAGAYNIAVAARVVSGELDVEALGRALARLVARHEGLRTVFPAPDGKPVQRVLPKVPVLVEEGSRAEAWRPFDLEHGPLLRVVLDGPVVLFVVHHIVSDFWSLAVAARELSALYREETGGPAANLPPLPLSYVDFTHWQAATLAGPRGEALWEQWRERLAGLPDLELPTDRPRPPVQTWSGLARGVEIPATEADAVRSLAARHGATMFTALLAAFQTQLGRYAGQDDFAVGSPTVGRGAPELDGLIGYFVNPVPLRADLAGNPSFGILLDRTRRTAVEGLAHSGFPFALLAERLRPARDPARLPVFQALLVLEQRRAGDPPGMPAFALSEDGARIPFADLELESVRLEERRAQLELSLSAAELPSGGLGISLEVNADLFDGATAERMLGHLRTLLAAAAADLDTPLDLLQLLTQLERAQLSRDWSTAPVVAVPDLCLHELVAEQALRRPEAEAVVAGDESLTYRELVERARALAERLRGLGVEPEKPVALCVERSAEMIVGVLGILEAGGVYLPLDPDHSAARLGFVLEDAGAAAVVTDA